MHPEDLTTSDERDVVARRLAFIGSMRGELEYPESFNERDPEIERLFGIDEPRGASSENVAIR